MRFFVVYLLILFKTSHLFRGYVFLQFMNYICGENEERVLPSRYDEWGIHTQRVSLKKGYWYPSTFLDFKIFHIRCLFYHYSLQLWYKGIIFHYPYRHNEGFRVVSLDYYFIQFKSHRKTFYALSMKSFDSSTIFFYFFFFRLFNSTGPSQIQSSVLLIYPRPSFGRCHFATIHYCFL